MNLLDINAFCFLLYFDDNKCFIKVSGSGSPFIRTLKNKMLGELLWSSVLYMFALSVNNKTEIP